MVTIKSEICIPDDFTQGTCTVMLSEHDFTVFMEPCLVKNYEVTSKVDIIIYNVNQATLIDGSYIFDENPVCNYPEAVTVTNLPTFATHNEFSSDFTISKTNDLGLIGEYTVNLCSEIDVPDDYSMTTFTTLVFDYDFLI